jgi:hypothetical protein
MRNEHGLDYLDHAHLACTVKTWRFSTPDMRKGGLDRLSAQELGTSCDSVTLLILDVV